MTTSSSSEKRMRKPVGWTGEFVAASRTHAMNCDAWRARALKLRKLVRLEEAARAYMGALIGRSGPSLGESECRQ